MPIEPGERSVGVWILFKWNFSQLILNFLRAPEFKQKYLPQCRNHVVVFLDQVKQIYQHLLFGRPARIHLLLGAGNQHIRVLPFSTLGQRLLILFEEIVEVHFPFYLQILQITHISSNNNIAQITLPTSLNGTSKSYK